MPVTVVPKTEVTKVPTKEPTYVPTITPEPFVYSEPDFSGHTNPDESQYTTVFADLTKLKEGKQVFATTELPADWSSQEFLGFANKDHIYGYDVTSCDISNIDLSSVVNFNDLTFNNDTIWPKKLPEGFNPEQILETNKNPGLGTI
jgi:hypothetical protein